ncbi:carbohydrate ABC transporter permease [Leadbettera azotonutricia]|uniref:ABC transporter, permease protein n=1 Tax=Leadbettera azotonutricia (strain ATCC BAA-888 / DSM 13862 / ZAS-9) TaxID=545695 RepID=F5YDA0_LEAAZ|nr:sugar ABC transporter permease [Leadbettera azotonutricia]AEF80964.1 ABC transporter, permease protein [Leadbettera azotonutricia ZAS-9]
MIKKGGLNFFDHFAPFLMVIPALVCILAVHIYPSVRSVFMAFFDINLTRVARPFIGFGNFTEALKNPVVLRVLFNTFLWAVLSVFFGGFFALFVAQQLNKSFRGRALFRTLFLAPWVTPPIVVSMVWRQIFSRDFSPVSGLLMRIGLISKPINFLGDTNMYLGLISIPMIFLIVINIWSMFPFCMVMFLAAIQTVPLEMYEAARVDGASKLQVFWKITFPMLIPVIQTTVLMQSIWQFNSFNLSYLVTHGGPLNSTELLSVTVYNAAYSGFRYGYAAALSVIMLCIVAIPAAYSIINSLRGEKKSV